MRCSPRRLRELTSWLTLGRREQHLRLLRTRHPAPRSARPPRPRPDRNDGGAGQRRHHGRRRGRDRVGHRPPRHAGPRRRHRDRVGLVDQRRPHPGHLRAALEHHLRPRRRHRQVQYRAQAETRRAVVRRYLELDPAWHRRRSDRAAAGARGLRRRRALVADAVGLLRRSAWSSCSLVALVELFVRDGVLGTGRHWCWWCSCFGLNLLYQRCCAPRAREAQAARAEVGRRRARVRRGRPGGAQPRPGSPRSTPGSHPAWTRLRVRRPADRPDQLGLRPAAGAAADRSDPGRARRRRRGSTQGELTVGDLVGVVYLLLTISIPLNVISRFLSMLPMSGAGRERVNGVLAHPDVDAVRRRSC